MLVLISSLTLAYLSTVLTLRLPIGIRGPQLAERQKLTVLLQTYVLTWLFLLASTIAVGELRVGGVYFISAWNAVALLGSVLGCVEVMLRAQAMEVERVVRFTAPDESEEGPGPLEEVVEEEPTEQTPLIQRQRLRPSLKSDEGGAIGWWILQVAVMVPVPVILVLHITVLLLASLSQTLADGSSPVIGAFPLLVLLYLFSLKQEGMLSQYSLWRHFVTCRIHSPPTCPLQLQVAPLRDVHCRGMFHRHNRIHLAGVPLLPGCPPESLLPTKGRA